MLVQARVDTYAAGLYRVAGDVFEHPTYDPTAGDKNIVPVDPTTPVRANPVFSPEQIGVPKFATAPVQVPTQSAAIGPLMAGTQPYFPTAPAAVEVTPQPVPARRPAPKQGP